MRDDRHIVVLGGGVGGLSTAVHLAAAGARVTLVEREPTHDRHSTGRSAEIQRVAIDDPVTRALALETAERLDDSLVERSGLCVATDESAPAWLGDVEAARAGGRVDDFGPSAGHVRAAGKHLFAFPRAGRIRASRLVAGLAREALARGVEVRRSAGAASIELEGGAVHAVRLPGRGELRCDALVVAAGAWSRGLGASIGAPLPLRSTVRHMFRIRGGAAPTPRTPIVWDDAADLYLRPDGNGWALSICDLTDASPESARDAYALDPSVEARALERLADFAPECARGARVARAWVGFRDLSPDDRPVLGPDERVPGLYWCAGLGGHGMTISLAVGRHAAGAVLGEPSELARRCGASRF